MPIQNPAQLAEEFKRSGEFDRLRRELLEEFRDGEGLAPFVARVEDIVRKRLHYDSKLLFGPEATAQRELAQELDRYPVLERAVSDIPSLTDTDFSARIRESLSRVLEENRSGETAAGGDVDMEDQRTLTQLQTPATDGRAASRHQELEDSEWDSAMEESPTSETEDAIIEVNHRVGDSQVVIPQIAEPSAASSPEADSMAIELPSVDSPAPDPMVIEPSMASSPVPESMVVEPTVVNPPLLDSMSVEPSAISTPAANPTAIESPPVDLSTTTTMDVEPPKLEPSAPDTSIAELSIVNSPTVDSSDMHHSPTEMTVAQPPLGEARAADSAADEALAVDSPVTNIPASVSQQVEHTVSDSAGVTGLPADITVTEGVAPVDISLEAKPISDDTTTVQPPAPAVDATASEPTVAATALDNSLQHNSQGDAIVEPLNSSDTSGETPA